MMKRRIEISAFRRRSRPQIYTDETQIVYRRTRICPRNAQKDTKALNSSLDFFVSFRLFHGQSPFVGINSQKATPNAFASKQDDGLRTTRWDFLLTRHEEKSAIAKTRSLLQARDWRVFF